MIHPAVRRLSNARDAMRSAGLDALVVTHQPNVRYLTGFNGSAGTVVVTRSRCLLIVDFRYATAARELLDARRDDAVELNEVERGYDESLVALLRTERVQRIGVEAAWMAVNRFNRLSAGMGSSLPGMAGRARG